MTLLKQFALFSTCLFCISGRLKAQNLVPDGGFEKANRVFDGADTVYVYDHWISLLSFQKLSPNGHPIFSQYQRIKPHDKYLHYWTPYEGDSYMFSHVVYYRNLYQTKLTDGLRPGHVYRVSFKYKIGADGFSKEKIETSVNYKIGVMLTNKDMADSTGMKIMKNEDIELRPQITLNAVDGDSIFKWQDFSYYFKPKKPFQYLIIGNFEKIIESFELRYHPITGAGYKIDNVSIELVSDSEFVQTKLRNQEMLETKQKAKEKWRIKDSH